jgi:prolyl 4-hydroxylase
MVMMLFLLKILLMMPSSHQLVSEQCENKDDGLNATNISPQIKLYGEESKDIFIRVKVYCPSVDIYFESAEGERLVFTLPFGTELGRSVAEGDIYFATVSGRRDKVLARHVITRESHYFPIIDHENPPPPAYMQLFHEELAFFAEYRKRTGIKWQQYFGVDGPRRRPNYHMWPAPYIGHSRIIRSDHGLWHCSDGDEGECQSYDPVVMELTTISKQPRIFFIPRLMSEVEADVIIRLAKPRLHKSSVGSPDGGQTEYSEVRSSQTGWIHRDDSPIIDSLYRRIGDLLNIDESVIRKGRAAEDMQVVYYTKGGKYDEHYDWEFKGIPPSRFITLLLYLNEPIAGGETAFPKAANGTGIKIVPKKGSAVLFYNLLEDGNADELTMHAALPVMEGEKWLSNIWIWDS